MPKDITLFCCGIIETTYLGNINFFFLNILIVAKCNLKSLYLYKICVWHECWCVCMHDHVCEYRFTMPWLLCRGQRTNPVIGLCLLSWDGSLYFKYLFYIYLCWYVHFCRSTWSQAYWCLWEKRGASDSVCWRHTLVNCLTWVELSHGFLPGQ